MYYTKIFENLPIAVIIFNTGKNIIEYANAKAAEQFAIDLSINNNFADNIKPEIYNEFLRLSELIKTNQVVRDFHLKQSDGTVININGNLIKDEQFALYLQIAANIDAPEPTITYVGIMGQVIQAFYSCKNTEEMINTILKTLVNSLGVCRAYIYEFINMIDDDIIKCRYEYCKENTVANKEKNPVLHLSAFDFNDNLRRGLPITYSDNIPGELKGIWELNIDDVKAFNHYPLMQEDKCLGFLGVDYCDAEHEWTDEEKNILTDVSALIMEMIIRLHLEEQATQINKTMTTVLDNLNTWIYVIDFDTKKLLFANKTLREFLGDKYVLGKKCWDVLRPDLGEPCSFCENNKLVDAEGIPLGIIHRHDVFNDYTKRWYYVSESLIDWLDSEKAVLMVTFDITERKKIEKELEYFASTDSLTGAYNRIWGLKLLDERYLNAKTSNIPLTVCFFDINRLKKVNDIYGHSAGDNLIRIIALTLKKHIDSKGIVIRIGGDEFLAVFDNYNMQDALETIETIQDKLKEFNNNSDLPYKCEMCYGLESVEISDNISVDDIILMADSKMYVQKRNLINKTEGYYDRRK